MEYDSVQPSHTGMDGDFLSSKVFLKTGLGELTTKTIQLTAQHSPKPKQPAPNFEYAGANMQKYKCNGTKQVITASNPKRAADMFAAMFADRAGSGVKSLAPHEEEVCTMEKNIELAF